MLQDQNTGLSPYVNKQEGRGLLKILLQQGRDMNFSIIIDGLYQAPCLDLTPFNLYPVPQFFLKIT